MHLKIMRVFIEGVLRFGIPPKFYMGIIKPSRAQDKKIMDRLLANFSEEHLKEMYGGKEDALDEDFFPYVINQINLS
jgi:hypothetical protein